MNKVMQLISASILLASVTTTAQAFDGNRKGFQVGLGIGAHTTAMNFSDSNRPGSFDSEKKLAASFQLGYGFSNTITGFIGGKGGSVLVDGFEGMFSFGGIGATVYLAESSPALYLTGLIGQGSLSMNQADAENADLRDAGSGWLAGIGYEVTSRLHLEFTYGQAELTDPNNDQNTSTLESAFATVQYIWY